ncbi:hypothetical protein T05_12114 [Trichinella murrelli]|uniref:Uncharacterized protein n=1 Tax=Trichinella murrelli TaxID=144512 RepID=A0A0V0UIY5_9BILA|nr:hypothetical protein T05_12114 [Trichinella murrelli]
MLSFMFLFIFPSEQELKMFSILPSEHVFNFLVNFFAKDIEKPSKGERVLSSVKADGRTEISCYEARNRKA